MQKFEFFDHAGDQGIQVFGKTLPDLFSHAAEALFQVITDPETIQPKEIRRISLQANDLEELLIDWLNEFIYLFETQGLLFRDFDFLALDAQALKATVRGEPYDASRHPIETTVKSATHHQLKVRREKGVWKVQVTLDL
jgi:SHS2 domain-containing protein